jgi:4a-hydroxytetrahydrobiopterin dehydratase
MASRTPLTEEEVRAALDGLPGWAHEGDALAKAFTFGDFRQAVAFIVRVAFEAEQRDHHPNLTNVYNRVELALTTHDAGNRVTAKDVDLAQAIEKIRL